ncbi:MAG TPA: primosomal protein N' [Blastocatellia bacterium]|nr:primosomal protein N' [Blastocatellia bacterium]
MFAEVAVPVHVRQTFTYNLPGDLASRASIGSRVTVPFGQKTVTGFIVALHEDPAGEVARSDIKDVEELIDEAPIITREILELTRWVSDYYFAPWGECIRAALPSGAAVVSERVLTITDAGRSEISHLDRTSPRRLALELFLQSDIVTVRQLERQFSKPRAAAMIKQLERGGLIRVAQRVGETRMKPKLQNAVRLTGSGFGVKSSESTERVALEGDGEKQGSKTRTPNRKPRTRNSAAPLNEKQQRVIELIRLRGEPVALSELLDEAGVTGSVVRTLEKRGVVEVFAREVRRDPLAHVARHAAEAVTLNAEQQTGLDQIVSQLDARKYSTFLLHGVTGSGKTEIYLRAMREAISRGLGVLMLVPEISLTPVLSRRLRANFGDAVAILHSSLSEGERIDEWRRIKQGDARVVIGTRSAVFAPIENLGLIIVDEEHESSYKQDESPRYHGRDTAIMRAMQANAVAVLGSATPSVESYHNARSGKYTYVKLQARYADRALAAVEVVDMREVFKRHGKQRTFSDELIQAIDETHSRGEQSMILLNRRGFSAFALCRSCGLAIHCPDCDVTLTFHRYNESLQCHYCGYIRPAPRVCPACEGQYIHYVGYGTEQLEAKLREMFPAMNIARLDRDTTRRRGSFEQIIMEFAEGGIDLLVGTQMIAKGHDFHNVTLVGVVSVDAGLALPDFRASERTFQLLTQVSGRAGRGDRPGRVIIQTYHPQHYSMVYAREQNYEEFYNRESNFRAAMHYPPFSAMVNVLVHDKDLNRANTTASQFARELREAASGSGLRVLGPAPAPISRIKGEHRVQVLIKAITRSQAREALERAMDRTLAGGASARSINVEVDPMNLM